MTGPRSLPSGEVSGLTRLVKFGSVGVSGVGVNLLFVWIGVQIFGGFADPIRDASASALGIVVSIFTNFLLNDTWTWGDRRKGPRLRDLGARLGAFCAASSVAAVVQFGVAQGLVHGMGVNLYLAQSIGIGLASIVNFVANHVWTFRDQWVGNA